MAKEIDLKQIKKAMEKELDAKRFEHTLGVAYTAAAMAMCHGEDVNNARLAGLLHDCAKHLVTEPLLHAKVGAHLAKARYGVDNQDVLNAILYHTTGRPGMSCLEKIIYIADYIEPNRKPLPNMEQVRKMAFVDLDKTMAMILRDTLQYLEEKGSAIDDMSRKAYQYYCKKEGEVYGAE